MSANLAQPASLVERVISVLYNTSITQLCVISHLHMLWRHDNSISLRRSCQTLKIPQEAQEETTATVMPLVTDFDHIH